MSQNGVFKKDAICNVPKLTDSSSGWGYAPKP